MLIGKVFIVFIFTLGAINIFDIATNAVVKVQLNNLKHREVMTALEGRRLGKLSTDDLIALNLKNEVDEKIESESDG